MVYENVLALCRKEGISISALEIKCGLGNATIRGWEKGNPRLDRVKPVAGYFGVTVDWLMEKHDDPSTAE